MVFLEACKVVGHTHDGVCLAAERAGCNVPTCPGPFWLMGTGKLTQTPTSKGMHKTSEETWHSQAIVSRLRIEGAMKP